MEKNLDTIRHSLAHVLASAVYQMFPEAKFGIGPTIENGFYYDFDLPRTLIPEDLEILETKMRELIKKDIKFEKKEVKIAEAKKFFEEAKQPYKVELAEELAAGGREQAAVYKTGDFVDLCSGPHVESTKDLNPKSYKLTSIAGAYWHGDEKNKMLQRIYGVAFENKKELDKYLRLKKEEKKRDHRKIGKKMDLFSFSRSGPGFLFWHSKGTIIFNEILDFERELIKKNGYQEIRTPIILNKKIWEMSGHYDHYRENMYFTEIDRQKYAIKPMNCPGAVLVYNDSLHSYKELPLKLAEFGIVHRHEKSGVLQGLFRVRMFTQDDAHIFCEYKQIEQEVKKLIILILEVYNRFNFKDVKIELSTKPENSIGTDEQWEKAEKSLKKALNSKKIIYKENVGEGAFYGPKIDFYIKDVIGRSWQLGTIQVDFAMPMKERLKATYVNEKGKEEPVAIIHRTLIGSMERFIGILIEHYAGLFPLWLAPEQVRILPISDKFNDYGNKIALKLQESDIRVKLDDSNESLGKKIRNAELEKIPYMFIVGEKEKKAGTVSVRHHSKGDLGSKKLEEILKTLASEITEKKIIK